MSTIINNLRDLVAVISEDDEGDFMIDGQLNKHVVYKAQSLIETIELNKKPKPLNHWRLTETLGLTEMPNGFWLYDKTRGMNLAYEANTEQDAFVEALTYYQKRLTQVEKDYKNLEAKVNDFLSQFSEDYEVEQ